MKTKQDNDMTNRINLVYVEIEIELSIPIWPSAVFDENQTRQQRDRSYKCGLCKKW